jgi:hypothetical protein
MSLHDFTLTGDYTTEPAALVLLEAATADTQPLPFEVTSALRRLGVTDLRVRELTDGRLHVQHVPTNSWQPLDAVAEGMV